MTQKEINSKMYLFRKNNCLCQRCGRNLDGKSKYYCTECNEKYRDYYKNNRKFYISIGICPKCRKEKLFGEEKSCIECRAKRIQYRNTSDEYIEEHRRKMRALHAECVEKGLCTRCHKRKAVYNRKKCEICLEKDRVYQSLRRK